MGYTVDQSMNVFIRGACLRHPVMLVDSFSRWGGGISGGHPNPSRKRVWADGGDPLPGASFQ